MSLNFSTKMSAVTRWFRNPMHILLIIIVVAGIFFRFYGTPERFGFDKDPTRDFFVTTYGVEHTEFPLVGPASGIASFTFGPWYYYQLIFFSILVPIQFAPFYFIPFFSISLIFIMYFIGKELCDEYLGIILSLFAAFSPSVVGPVAGLSNPNLISPHAGLGILIFILFMKKKGSIWLGLIWGIVMGIGINDHYQMIPLLLLPAIYYLLYIKTSLKSLMTFILGLGITFLPLLYFNFHYHWYTLDGIVKFIHSGGSNNYIPNNWHIYLFDFWPKFFGYIFAIPEKISIAVVSLIGVFYLYYFLIRKKKDITIILLLTIFAIVFMLLRYYNAERSFYYFIFIEPILFVVVGFALRMLGNTMIGKVLIGIACLVFFLLSFPKNMEQTKPNHDQRIARTNIRMLENVFPSTNFTIYTCQQKAIERALGVAVLLESNKKLSEDGQKIGFNNSLDNCPLPEISVTTLSKDIYDFHKIPDPILNKYGWYKITPETVYKNTVLWWTPQYEKI